MKVREIEARIKRLEYVLGLEDIPGLTSNAVKAKRDETGAGFIDAKEMVARELIKSIFKESMTNPPSGERR